MCLSVCLNQQRTIRFVLEEVNPHVMLTAGKSCSDWKTRLFYLSHLSTWGVLSFKIISWFFSRPTYSRQQHVCFKSRKTSNTYYLSKLWKQRDDGTSFDIHWLLITIPHNILAAIFLLTSSMWYAWQAVRTALYKVDIPVPVFVMNSIHQCSYHINIVSELPDNLQRRQLLKGCSAGWVGGAANRGAL